MIATLLLLAASAASPVRAQTLEELSVAGARFETIAASALQEQAPQDPFDGLPACAQLDARRFRPLSLEEASEQLRPCLEAALKRYGAAAEVAQGFLAAPAAGGDARVGLVLATDLVPGSRGHRELGLALARRGGRLMDHPALLLTRGEDGPVKASAIQSVLAGCVTMARVRELRSGADFLAAYGGCLRREPSLKITDLAPRSGLAVTLQTANDAAAAESYSGVVTVNVGHGPVQVLVAATSR